jgi:hypothetical protein
MALATVLDRAAPVPPPKLARPGSTVSARAEVAWAGGLFEGQGSIELHLDGIVLLSLASTDKDVIDRFRSVVGAGRLCSQPPGRSGRRERTWRLDILQVEDVLRGINLLYPWLGERLRARADEGVRILTAPRSGTEVARTPSLEQLL